MSSISTLSSQMQSQVSRAPTAAFSKQAGAFNADRQQSVANKPTADSVVISSEARAKLNALDQLQVSNRVLASDPKGTRINIAA
jgi:hypothetical protein